MKTSDKKEKKFGSGLAGLNGGLNSTRKLIRRGRNMAGPFCGKRVMIEGLMQRQELNGKVGVATSYDEASARYIVALPAGERIALLPKNLAPVADSSSSEGMPGAGMGGMPHGMPGMGNLAEMLPLLLSRLGLQGVQTTHLAVAGVLVVYLLFYASWSLQALVTGLCALTFFAQRSTFERAGGGIKGLVEVGRAAASHAAARASSMSGRPVSSTHVLGGLGGLLAVAAYLLPAGRGISASSIPHPEDFALRAAYHAGYDDATAGKLRDPDYFLAHHAPAPAFSSPAPPPSRFGVSSFINLMLIGSMLFRMGGSPWSLNTAIATARQNPLQLVMAAMMMSRMM